MRERLYVRASADEARARRRTAEARGEASVSALVRKLLNAQRISPRSVTPVPPSLAGLPLQDDWQATLEQIARGGAPPP
jgi:hypothetical protein